MNPIELTYDTFNSKKYSRIIKRKLESSNYLCKLKIVGNDIEANTVNRLIIKTLNSIIRNPIVFENEMIYIVLNQVELFTGFIDEFKDALSGIRDKEKIKERHKTYFQNQKILLQHLYEIQENPHKMPSFIVKP
jgi:hypothetical protein